MADSPSESDRAIEEWGEKIEGDDRIAGLIYRAGFQSYLGGQLFVRAIELEEEAGAPGTVVLTATRDVARDFLSMPFAEAVAFFRDKRIISPEVFDELNDRYREGGFIARQLCTERLVQAARDAVARSLEQGLTLAETAARFRLDESDEVTSLGIAPTASHYLDTVLKTNVAVAYGAGRYAAITDPAVVALRPYVRYMTALDSRVRKAHQALHGKVFRVGSELFRLYAPPLGYRCRCVLATLSERQFEARGYVLTDSPVEGARPGKGWEGAPSVLGLDGEPTEPL